MADTKIKRCANCVHWDKEQGLDVEEANYSQGNRLCMAGVFITDLRQDEAMVVCDGSYYMGYLYTSPGHSCKEFKAKEQCRTK